MVLTACAALAVTVISDQWSGKGKIFFDGIFSEQPNMAVSVHQGGT